MPSRFVCEEWERRQRPAIASLDAPSVPPPALAALAPPSRDAPPAPDPAAPFALTPPVPRPRSARDRARAAYAAALPGGAAVVVAEPPPGDPLPIVDPRRVAALAAACAEVHLTSDLGDVFLVPDRTPADRLELTFEDAAVLATVVAAFPGSRVVGLTKGRIGERDPKPKNGMAYDPARLAMAPLRMAPDPEPAPPTADPRSPTADLLRCWGCDKVDVAAPGDLCGACEG